MPQAVDQAIPYLAAGVCLGALLLAITLHTRRLERHALWLSRLTLRVDNLHKERDKARVQSLQILPPPLPDRLGPLTPGPRTFGGKDWGDDFNETSLLERETKRYPVPPVAPPRPPRKN